MHILELVQMDNVATVLEPSMLAEIGNRVVQEYDVDRGTMREWLQSNENAMKIVASRTPQKEGMANATLPLVFTSANRLSAEEFPEVVRDKELVKAVVFGQQNDAKKLRGERVASRMNYQFYHQMPRWVEEHDRLTQAKNLLGCVHKKVYYCKERGHTQSEVRLFGIVVNDTATSVDDAPRISDEFDLHVWQVQERIRSGLWLDVDLPKGTATDTAESDRTQTFIEQLRREDLDEDGYAEPYVVTVHKETRKVVCIIPNYTDDALQFQQPPTPEQPLPPVVRVDPKRSRVRYVRYYMMPSPEGGYWAWGFGRLLAPLNDNCNALVNELLDAGRLQNAGGGFLSQNLRLGKGEIEVRAGTWHSVPAAGSMLRDSIVPFPMPQPSPTLFQLLGLLMETLRDISSVSRVMSGEQPRSNMPGVSVLALIEQGKKAMSAIYKRHYLALSEEVLALFDMDYLYEDPEDYKAFHDDPIADPRRDFDRGGIDILPTASAEFSTRIQRMAEAEALMPLAQDPRVNGALILRRYVEGITNDAEAAAALVPAEPNITPDQLVQRLQVMRQELLAQMDVRKAEAEAQQAELALQRAIVEAQKAGIEMPSRIAKIEAGAARAQLQVVSDMLDVRIKEKELASKEE